MNKLLLVLVSCLALAGCVSSAGSKIPGKSYAATNPDSVQVLYENPQRLYEVVGHVTVQRAIVGSDTANERKFRTVAASMGADAVIVDVIPKASYFGAYVQGQGRAIKFK